MNPQDEYVAPITNVGLQQDILICLCFRTDYAKQLRGFVRYNHFTGYEREFAFLILNHLEKNNESPGDFIATIVDHLINPPDDAKAKNHLQILSALLRSKEQSDSNSFCENTLKAARAFVRQQTLRAAVESTAQSLSSPTGVVSDDAVDAAIDKIRGAMSLELKAFEPGVNFGDFNSIRAALAKHRVETMPTGIELLDKFKAGPVRGGLHVLIAPAKAGKTMWLTHLGAESILQQLKVLHISLEMSEGAVVYRYLQNIFNIAKRPGPFIGSAFAVEDGKVVGVLPKVYQPNIISGNDDDYLDEVETKHATGWDRIGRNLRVKAFPTGTLTIAELDAHLEMLASREKFHPDLLICDYPDLMKIPTKDFRLGLGKVFVDLRGLAGRWDLAVAAVTQANRAASKSGVTDVTSVAEDWSKIATADTVMAYSVRPDERQRKVARLSVVASRNDAAISLAIAQNYDCGRFCVDAVYEPYNLEQLLTGAGKDDDSD